jgi:predicted phosphodiesterase
LKPIFAYFTDVHGNIDALQAVVNDACSYGVDRFICGGDMIGIGPFTNEVLEVLFGLPSIQMVTGNHDEAILALKLGQPHPASHIHARNHHQWIADRLDESFAEKLYNLPREVTFEDNHFRFFITHYPFKQGKKESPISEDPFMPIFNEPNLETIQQLFVNETNYDFIGFGHHHILHNFKCGRTHFVNPGALGCNTIAEARYALIYKDNQKVRVEYKSVPYDRTKLVDTYSKYDMPEAAFLLKAFHHVY